MNILKEAELNRQDLDSQSPEMDTKSLSGSQVIISSEVNHNSPSQVNQNQTGDDGFVKANGSQQSKQGRLQTGQKEKWHSQGQLGTKSLPSDVDQTTQKKTVLLNVFQRKPKQPLAATPEQAYSFHMDPAVNRPQVLAPSAVESVRMRGLKEKTEGAFSWSRPTNPPLGNSFSAASSTCSAITDLFSKSTLAQSSTTRSAATTRQRHSIGSPMDKLHGVSIKPSDFIANIGAVGQPTENAAAQACKSPFMHSSHSATNFSGETVTGQTGRTPMSQWLKSGRGEGLEDSEESVKCPAFGPNEFLKLYRSRAYSDPRRLSDPGGTAVKSNHRRHRHNSAGETNLSSFSASSKQLDGGATADDENRQIMPSRSRKRLSQNLLVEMPDTIHEHKEMYFNRSSISLPSASLCVADSEDNPCPATSSSPSSSSSSLPSSSSSFAAGNNANDRRSRQLRITDRRFSEPPMYSFREMSNLHFCYMKTTQAQQQNGFSSQNDSSNGSSSSVSSISIPVKRLTDSCISPESLGIDPPLVSRHHLVLWRDQQSTQILKLPVAVEYHDTLQEIIADDDFLIYSELMKLHRCWELMPNSSTVVVLDVELKVILAFHALTVHGIVAAVLWDSNARRFVGMLTVTDFIRVLQKYRNSMEHLEGIKNDKISQWKEQLMGEGDGCGSGLTCVDPDDSLYEAVCILHSSGFHRLPVIDDVRNNVLYTLGYRRILQFICLFMNRLPRPNFMNRTIWELQVGTFNAIASIRHDRPLYEAMDLLVGRRVSALPVVDSEDRVINIYCKSDAMALAAREFYKNLNITIGEALSTERESFEGIYLCKRTDSLHQVVEWLARTNVHRLIVVDADQRLQGIVSLSDVVRFIVLHPPKKAAQMEDGEIVVQNRIEDTTGVQELTAVTKDDKPPNL